jgi:hypothetical protein
MSLLDEASNPYAQPSTLPLSPMTRTNISCQSVKEKVGSLPVPIRIRVNRARPPPNQQQCHMQSVSHVILSLSTGFRI